MRNYFRNSTATIVVTFDDRHEWEIRAAWERASEATKLLVLGRPVPHAGPWDDLPIVGHRAWSAVQRDLKGAQERLRWLEGATLPQEGAITAARANVRRLTEELATVERVATSRRQAEVAE